MIPQFRRTPLYIAISLSLLAFGMPILGYGQKIDNTSQEAAAVNLQLKGMKAPVKIPATLEQALKTYPQIKDAKKLDSFLAKKRGGDVSGGGTTLLINGQRFLIDLFGEINFSETANSSDSFGRGNLDRIDLQRTSLNTEIQASIERVKGASPEKMILTTLMPLVNDANKISRTDLSLADQDIVVMCVKAKKN